MTFTLNTKAGREATRISLFLKRAAAIREGRIKSTPEDEKFAKEYAGEIARYVAAGHKITGERAAVPRR